MSSHCLHFVSLLTLPMSIYSHLTLTFYFKQHCLSCSHFILAPDLARHRIILLSHFILHHNCELYPVSLNRVHQCLLTQSTVKSSLPSLSLPPYVILIHFACSSLLSMFACLLISSPFVSV